MSSPCACMTALIFLRVACRDAPTVPCAPVVPEPTPARRSHSMRKRSFCTRSDPTSPKERRRSAHRWTLHAAPSCFAAMRSGSITSRARRSPANLAPSERPPRLVFDGISISYGRLGIRQGAAIDLDGRRLVERRFGHATQLNEAVERAAQRLGERLGCRGSPDRRREAPTRTRDGHFEIARRPWLRAFAGAGFGRSSRTRAGRGRAPPRVSQRFHRPQPGVHLSNAHEHRRAASAHGVHVQSARQRDRCGRATRGRAP